MKGTKYNLKEIMEVQLRVQCGLVSTKSDSDSVGITVIFLADCGPAKSGEIVVNLLQPKSCRIQPTMLTINLN